MPPSSPARRGSARNPSESTVRKANWNRSCWRKPDGAGARFAIARNWSLSPRDNGVIATIKDLDSGALSAVHADYLLAADGTHSPIRRQLGVTTSGFGELPVFVVFIYFRAPWRQFVPDLGDGDAVQSIIPT